MKYTKKKDTFKFKHGGADAYATKELVPYFQFKSEWKYLEDGQEQLENLRFKTFKPYQGDMRRFARTVTAYIKLPTKLKELLDFIDKSFYNTVTLYGFLCLIYMTLSTKGYQQRNVIELSFTDFMQKTLATYFKKRKEKRLKWNALSKDQQQEIIDQILAVLWANLKDLKLVVQAVGPDNKSYIYPSPNFDISFLNQGEFWAFLDLPCINTPHDWVKATDGIIRGGYWTIYKPIVRKKLGFIGNWEIKQSLLDVINKLQRMQWCITPLALDYISKEFDYIESYLNKNSREGSTQLDSLQDLNTYLFLKYFCTKFDAFYYPLNICFRARVYPLPAWFASATSSKRIRSYLELTQPESLDNAGKAWLKLKLCLTAGVTGKTYKEMQDTLNIEDFNFENKKIETFSEALQYQIYKDIKNGTTKQLIELDTTASAIGFVGLIMNDEKILTSVGLSGQESEKGGPNSPYLREDIYMYIAKKCEKNLPEPFMKHFTESRDLMKSLIMPYPYAISEYTSVSKIHDFVDSFRIVENSNEENTLYNHIISTMNRNTLDDNVKLNNPLNWEKTYDSTEKYNWKKVHYYCYWFYLHFEKILNQELPALAEYMQYFNSKEATLHNFIFDSTFYKFQNKYQQIEKYKTSVYINKKDQEFTMVRGTNQTDNEKEHLSAAANFIHALDAYIVHYVCEKLPLNIQITTIHDCFMVSPQHANLVINLIREAYISAQNYIKKIPEFEKYHKQGSVPIISNNIVKISYSYSKIKKS